MATSPLSNLLNQVSAELSQAYNQGQDDNSSVLLFQGLGTPVSPSDFKLNPGDAAFSQARAVELFSQLIDRIPTVSGTGAHTTSRLVSDFYQMAVDGSLPASTDPAAISSFSVERLDAQKKFDPTVIGSMRGPVQFHPSYATPTDWYDASAAGNWTTFSSTAPDTTVPGAPGVPSSPGWWTPGNNITTTSSTGFSISFDYCFVQAERPWFTDSFLYSGGWYLPSRRSGWLSSGSLQDSAAIMPCISFGFVVVKNLKISANWSQSDLQVAQSAIGLGFFALQASAATSSSVSNPGLQIVAWIAQPTPILPPVSDPSLAGYSITAPLNDVTSYFGSIPMSEFAVTMKDLSLTLDVDKSGGYTATLTGTMVETALNGSMLEPKDSSAHTYTGTGTLDGFAVSATLAADSGNDPECRATVKGSIVGNTFVGTVTVKRIDEQAPLAWQTIHHAPPSTTVGPGVIQYRSIDPTSPLSGAEGFLVTRTTGEESHTFQIQFTVPPYPPIPPFIMLTTPPFILLIVGANQIPPTGPNSNPPPTMFPHYNANFLPGMVVMFAVTLPQNICDASQGWNLRCSLGSPALMFPSPNLLLATSAAPSAQGPAA